MPSESGLRRCRKVASLLIWFFAFLPCSTMAARIEPPLPPTVLILDQLAPLRPWSTAIIQAIRSGEDGNPDRSISCYVEHLDLFDCEKREYDENFLSHLTDKYKRKPVGVILSIGPLALDFAIKLRDTAWPAVPIVFTALSEESAPHPLPPNTTGLFVRKSFSNMVKTARTVVPHLKRLVLIGNPFEGAVYYLQFADEIPKLSSDYEIIDFMGLSVREIRQRIGMLPADSAVLYFGITADSEKRYGSAVEALHLIAEASNRPIIGDVETQIGQGVIGGFILRPHQIGLDAKKVVTRLLDGEEVLNIPVATGNTHDMMVPSNTKPPIV